MGQLARIDLEWTLRVDVLWVSPRKGAIDALDNSKYLDTPRLVADSTGTTVWKWDQQEPFGDSVPDENPSGLGGFDLPLRLPGQRYDQETGLRYNYYRDYDPSLGRYSESDLIGLGGGLNTYAYVYGSPLTYVDPEGRRGVVILAGAAVGAIAGGVIANYSGQSILGGMLAGAAIGTAVSTGNVGLMSAVALGAISGGVSASLTGGDPLLGAGLGGATGLLGGATLAPLLGEGLPALLAARGGTSALASIAGQAQRIGTDPCFEFNYPLIAAAGLGGIGAGAYSAIPATLGIEANLAGRVALGAPSVLIQTSSNVLGSSLGSNRRSSCGCSP